MVCSLGKPYAKVQNYAEENYYSKNLGISNSQWFGHGAAILGLKNQVTPKDYINAYQGIDPYGNSLRQRQSNRNSNPGRDVTFSAPKSVSLLALVKEDSEIINAHKQAVHAAIAYIEKNCIFTRTGKGGANHQRTDNALVAIFQHDDNRNQDPQLHSHCVIFNQTQGQDEKWRSIDNRELYQQQLTIGMVYHHELAKKIKLLGYEIDWNQDGTFNVKDYTQEQLRAFSSRRQEIIDAVGEDANLGIRDKACTYTRIGKLYKTVQEKQVIKAQWQSKAEELNIFHPIPSWQNKKEFQQSVNIAAQKHLVDRAIRTIGSHSNKTEFSRGNASKFPKPGR
jgi:conjugative relaxase-like TrwC/TraI family protein